MKKKIRGGALLFSEIRARCFRPRIKLSHTTHVIFLFKYSTRQRKADSKNMDRIAREMKKVDTQLIVVEEEFEKIKVINGAIKNKLIGEEDKALTAEENLKVSIETGFGLVHDYLIDKLNE